MVENVKNALTFDIEEYFHAFCYLGMCPPETWHSYPSRVEAPTHLILDVLDENSTKATFFVLGCVAERWPGLVREIAKRGHEVATHGYGHELIYRQDRKQFREDVERAKAVLEDIISSPVTGYRAPSFSIIPETAWAWDELAALGFEYDSSVFPIRGHDIYGFPQASPTPWVLHNGLAELPLTTTEFFGRNLPVGGGGYFRIYPYTITRWLLRRVNAKGRRGIVYLHPWELDPDQPRIRVSAKTRFRHYFGMRQTEGRLHRLFQDFTLGPIREVFEDVLGSSSKQLS